MKFNKANKNGKALYGAIRVGTRSKMRTGGVGRKARKATQFLLVFPKLFCYCEKGRRLMEAKQDT